MNPRHYSILPVVIGAVILGAGAPLRAAWAAEQGPVDPLSAGSLMQVVGGLLVVLLAFGVVMVLLRRMQGVRPQGSGRLRILEGISLGARDRVVLLQVGDSQVLLGLSPGRIQPLHVRENVPQEPEQPGQAVPFGTRLRQSLMRRTQGDGEQA